MAQGAVFLAQLAHQCEQFADTRFQALQLGLHRGFLSIRSDAEGNTARVGPEGSIAPVRIGHNQRRMAATSLTFDELQRALVQSRALADAAEAHGTLVGSLCASRCSLADWLAEILPEGRAEHASVALLDGTLAFSPLLPADDAPIGVRTLALGEWCQGFLYGLGTGVAVPEASQLPGEAAEVLRDMTEITHVDVDPADGAESNEAAYAELVEFVRVGVQLLFVELAPARGEEPAPGAASIH
jgi:uncharacterized protein YgfB (UPF0149 family)